MKEPYEEGLANRLGPASCAGDGNIAGVAGTGVHAGQVLTSEITTSACRPCPDMGKATRQMTLFGESSGDAAESKTLSTCGTFQHGNRETPETSSPASAASGPGGGERWEKVLDQASHADVFEDAEKGMSPITARRYEFSPTSGPVGDGKGAKSNYSAAAVRSRFPCDPSERDHSRSGTR